MVAGVNRFDFLRLAFASTVFVYHAIALTGISENGPSETLFAALAELSIQGFFIVSGALVFGSLERSNGLWTYGEKRLRRLYPAYLVIILLPVLASLIITGGNVGALGEIWHYAWANL
ncbi:MAG: acyltransferase family protein, partial [Alphaproteobacteria bacterium]|nr:acyltransferase family protein [Alphaproteobacteria bacterium]